ncbi:MAG TPA: non-canonical purine NTP pyrophosphatase [Acidobacteriaceae bacterium]|jgi:XTP/dITP diphosphohydrolase|nr:non-canonical purine NTP pyrophosphatase [Acidobacteriaceae bacterium]
MTIYAATTNPGKLREFAGCASASSIEVLALPKIEQMPEPAEDAATFLGNAEIKAIAYSKLAPNLLVFADDSGLEIDALGGQPGVRSARFADDLDFEPNQGANDQRNNRAVLSLLAQLPETREGASTRAARFVCALALARNGEVLLRARGEVEGQILDAPRGANGFGYDPLFLIPALGQTLAELPATQKWSLSHRGNAFRDLLRQLTQHPPMV